MRSLTGGEEISLDSLPCSEYGLKKNDQKAGAVTGGWGLREGCPSLKRKQNISA